MSNQEKYCLDANVLITAWQETYPPDLFPTPWEWLINCKNEIIFIKPVFDQIQPKNKDENNQEKSLRSWLDDKQFRIINLADEVDALSLQLEQKYQTKQISKGADSTDILLIAFAKIKNLTVVTLEAIQPQAPQTISNYKIPLICEKENVPCINSVELFRRISKKSKK